MEETPEPRPLPHPSDTLFLRHMDSWVTGGMRPSGRRRSCREKHGAHGMAMDQEWEEEGAYLSLSSRVCSFCASSRSCRTRMYSSCWSWISAFTACSLA